MVKIKETKTKIICDLCNFENQLSHEITIGGRIKDICRDCAEEIKKSFGI